MKSRFLAILSGILMASGSAWAVVVTTDVPGTTQAATESGKTANNILESATQVKQYQKTMAKIGTGVQSVSSFTTNVQKQISEKMQKIQEYQQKVQDYQAKFEAYKAEALEAAEIAKNPGGLAKGLANQVKGAATNMVSGVTDTVKQTANMAQNTAMSVKDTAMSAKDTVTDTAGAVKDQVGGSDASAPTNTGYEGGNSIDEAQGGGANRLVDAPVAMPTRRAIGTDSGVAMAVSSGGGTGAPAAAISAGAVAVSGAAMSANMATPQAPVQMAPQAQVISNAPEMAANVAEIAQKAVTQAQDLNMSVNDGNSVEQSVRSATTDIDMNVDKALVKEKVNQMADKLSSEAVLAKENVASKAKALDIKAKENIGTSKELIKSDKELVKSNTKAVKDVPAQLKNEMQKAKDLKQVAPATNRPRRASFKTSSGYGHSRETWPLAFASIGLKNGTTEDNVLIVPESLSMYCNLDYEAAGKKGAMDKCLKSVNALRSSSEDESSGKQRDDANKDLFNGMVEYLTAAYFEALEIYNDSLTFESKEVSPILTADAPDTDAAWQYAKSMNKVLGERINALNKLWARSLGVKTYTTYAWESIGQYEKQ